MCVCLEVPVNQITNGAVNVTEIFILSMTLLVVIFPLLVQCVNPLQVVGHDLILGSFIAINMSAY